MKAIPTSVLSAIAGTSLLLNSYFLKGIADDIQELKQSYYQLRIDNASRDAMLNNLITRIEILEVKRR